MLKDGIFGILGNHFGDEVSSIKHCLGSKMISIHENLQNSLGYEQER